MFSTLIAKIHSFMNRQPLARKMEMTYLVLIFLLLSGSFAGYYLINRSNQVLLNRTMNTSEAYAVSAISDSLSNIEKMTDMMIADSTIQDALSVSMDSDSNYALRAEAYSELQNTLPQYYQDFRKYGISFINLYTKNYTIYTDIGKTNFLNTERSDDFREEAAVQSGYVVWDTSYAETEGLYLVRDIRRAENLQLDRLGTVLVNVDLTKLIENCTGEISPADSHWYIFLDESGNVFYYSPGLDDETTLYICKHAASSYGVISNVPDSFFYVKGTIPNTDWSYISLMDYSSITQTRNNYFALTFIIVILLLFSGIRVASSMIRSISRPVTDLTRKMNAFAKDNTQIPESSADYSGRTDEIGLLHQNFDAMARQSKELIEKNYVNTLLTKDAQIKALESQINPHFLYNTLETLNWQAKALGADDISTMVEALGTMLRITLNRKDTSSNVKKELEIIRSYMAIMEIRFSDRVEYEIDIPEAFYTIEMPRLSVQPLVENAINYALENMIDVCNIRIYSGQDPDFFYIYVENNGSQFPDHLLERLESGELQPHGFGIGLQNINTRLKLLYGDACGLTLTNSEDEFFEETATVRISIPKKKTDPAKPAGK